MDIVQKHYPNDHHVFVYDNATTHTKRLATAPTATRMTKGSSTKFGGEVTVTVDGKIQYAGTGKPLKCTVQMGPGVLPNGLPHHFYNVPSTTVLGTFKGMTKLLQE
ncbi:hypothetical protein B0H34DRAFT_657165 [Crassisporium funariophilum]|nr:hypothetical protein B0H34DRAFT_657165 [Crassisporium funariophilum]